ncbi:MAG: ABC transporter substrate-binding protein [Xanthomonadales bacterium]|nr:ABC transporter substrate-binding protein [Xanthomonadales bacterium]
MMRLPLIKATLIFLLLSFSLQTQAMEPREIIQQSAHEVLTKINANRADYEANPEKLIQLVDDVLMPWFDDVYAARLILGRHGRGVPADKIQLFASAMQDLLVERYASSMLGFKSKDQLEVLKLRGKNTEKLTRVRARIALANNQWVPVEYSFHKVGDMWKMFDVTAEGISYIITYRNQIGPMVQADGIDAVIENLRSGSVKLKD